MFPPEVRRYGGMTAEFKATSQHIPVELLKKISFRLEGHWAPDSKEENEKIFVAEKQPRFCLKPKARFASS